MAARQTKRKRRVTFFFWEGKLHRVLRTSYPQNLVEAWCYKDRCTVALLYTDFRRNAQKALRTHEVYKLLRISRQTLETALTNQEIRDPERAYALDGNFNYRERWWSEKDVIELHEALLSHHRGRPRADGRITPNKRLPTIGEIKAFFRNETTLYIQTGDGRMVPVFEAQRW